MGCCSVSREKREDLARSVGRVSKVFLPPLHPSIFLYGAGVYCVSYRGRRQGGIQSICSFVSRNCLWRFQELKRVSLNDLLTCCTLTHMVQSLDINIGVVVAVIQMRHPSVTLQYEWCIYEDSCVSRFVSSCVPGGVYEMGHAMMSN